MISLSVLVASGGLGACQSRQPGVRDATAVPDASATSSAAESTQSGALSVGEFLRLSAELTSFDNLNPDLATIYLASLQAQPNPRLTLTDLYAQAGFRSAALPRSLEQMVISWSA
jgi:hypothetical protein